MRYEEDEGKSPFGFEIHFCLPSLVRTSIILVKFFYEMTNVIYGNVRENPIKNNIYKIFTLKTLITLVQLVPGHSPFFCEILEIISKFVLSEKD